MSEEPAPAPGDSDTGGEEVLRSGFVAVVGRPNVGKSTLVNAIVGGKVAITSSKPQTTRSAVRGILDVPSAQVVFVDTPGYHKPRTLLGERLNKVVRDVWSDVELALFVTDGPAGIGRGDVRVASDLKAAGCPTFCIVNKIDVIRRASIAAALDAASRLGDFEELIPASARPGEDVDLIKDLELQRMPEGPMYYPPGTRTDQPPPVFVAELVREKLLARAREELPHSIAVVTEDFEERDDGLLEIHALVYVERDSQKGIVIGKGGATLKAAASEARRELEVVFGARVHLTTHVTVAREWQRDPKLLGRLGY